MRDRTRRGLPAIAMLALGLGAAHPANADPGEHRHARFQELPRPAGYVKAGDKLIDREGWIGPWVAQRIKPDEDGITHWIGSFDREAPALGRGGWFPSSIPACPLRRLLAQRCWRSAHPRSTRV